MRQWAAHRHCDPEAHDGKEQATGAGTHACGLPAGWRALGGSGGRSGLRRRSSRTVALCGSGAWYAAAAGPPAPDASSRRSSVRVCSYLLAVAARREHPCTVVARATSAPRPQHFRTTRARRAAIGRFTFWQQWENRGAAPPMFAKNAVGMYARTPGVLRH